MERMKRTATVDATATGGSGCVGWTTQEQLDRVAAGEIGFIAPLGKMAPELDVPLFLSPPPNAAATYSEEINLENMKATQFVYDQNRFRIGQLIWLATCNDGISAPDALEEAIDDGQIEKVFCEMRGVDDVYDKKQVLAWLLDERKLGFLARVETPTPKIAHEGRNFTSYGWGMYGNIWVYADTLDELLTKAAEASNAYIDKKLAKLRAKSA